MCVCVFDCLSINYSMMHSYVYRPGIDAEAMIDDDITRICSDADVFVYVCDGKRTIEVKASIPCL